MGDDHRFVNSDLWRQLTASDGSVAFSAQKEVALRLTEVDLRDLLKTLESNSPKEQFAALGMLLMAVRGNNTFVGFLRDELRTKATQLAQAWAIEDVPLSSDKTDVLRRIEALLATDKPPDVARRAYALLAAIDRESAGQFLVSHFHYEGLAIRGREQLLHEFAELCSIDKSKRSATAMKRLTEIAEKGEPEAKTAAQYLIGRQLMQRSEVEKITESWRATPADELSSSAVSDFIAQHPHFVGREEELTKTANDWLKTKSIASLNRLYYDFLGCVPEGSATGPLLGILGAPNWWEDPHPNVYIFSSDEGPA